MAGTRCDFGPGKPGWNDPIPSLFDRLCEGTDVKIPPLAEWPQVTAPPLSDADVERIARRVVELLDEREARSQAEWEAFDAAEREKARQREARYEENDRRDREARAIAIARESEP